MNNPTQYDIWHSDPKNWKLFGFYYNKLDNRFWLPKRIKWTGWTINWAKIFELWQTQDLNQDQ
jgi:uncharacterized membrane protein